MKRLLVVVLFSAACAAWAMDPTEIVRRLERNQVYASAQMEGSITITDRFGPRVKTFKASTMGTDKMLLEFTNPEEAGQKILRLGDEIYLYFPEAEEVIRLQGSGLKDSVMGSDFSYEDLTGEKAVLDLYTVALEGTEVVDGRECYVLKLTGRKPTIAYPMERMWVDAELFVARKATSFSLSGKAIKEMTAGDFRVVAGRSIPGRVEMRDLMKKGSSTAFKVAKIAIDVPIDPKVFTREELSW